MSTMPNIATVCQHLAGAIALASLSVAPAAQTVPYDTALVVAVSSPGGTLTLEVDLHTGNFTALPGYSTDVYPPLAVTADPIDHSVLVALDTGAATQVMRRRWQPVPSEALVGTVPGHAVELLVDRFGDVIVVIGGNTGGLHRLPRLGGSPTLIRSVANIGAAGSPQHLHWNTVLGISGASSPAADPALGDLDLDSGNWNWGPIGMTGFQPLGITGVIDLPTAVPRQVLAHDDGSLSLYDWSLGGNPVVATTWPTLPSGGIAAMKNHDQPIGLLLGGAGNPHLYSFDPVAAMTGSINLTTLAGPLVGVPVDYAVLPSPGANIQTFGRPCGISAELRIDAAPGAGPVIGNTTFGVRLRQAMPNQPAIAILGFDETTFPLPTGCRVLVTLDAVALQWTDANGQAIQPIPLPNAANLVGIRFFGQWLQADFGLPFMASDLVRVEIGI